jgi:hypothetical protein
MEVGVGRLGKLAIEGWVRGWLAVGAGWATGLLAPVCFVLV